MVLRENQVKKFNKKKSQKAKLPKIRKRAQDLNWTKVSKGLRWLQEIYSTFGFLKAAKVLTT